MASSSSSSKVTIIFLLLIACFFSIQIQARQFFNKVSSIDGTQARPMEQKATPREEEERDPSFYAQTESSYGLYGRDSDPTTSTYKPYVTPVRYHPDEPYNAINPTNNNEKQQKQKLEEARLGDKNNDENSDHHVFGNDGKLQQQNNINFEEEAMFRERNNYVNNNGEEQGAERQGMSDTRFLEKGKYYYDINTKYPQTTDATHDDLIYNNNNGGRYGNLQGRRNANNYQEFNDQP